MSSHGHAFGDRLKELNLTIHENALYHASKIFIATHFCVSFVGAIFTEYFFMSF